MIREPYGNPSTETGVIEEARPTVLRGVCRLTDPGL